MRSERPNPDELLARVQAEEAKQARGKLKVFFGAAPGVGKTYAMLEAARKAAKEGADVVVGYIEPHARLETQALVLGLDMLPRREVEHRGTRLLEFDLDAALARRPQLILVDELAHTNAPGSPHAKRWQDVEKLLAAGIDVHSTLNVGHLESLNDVVAQITGVVVRETVPDSVFEQADEVELVDLAPDDLLERLREGKVYIPEQARQATENFFQKGNLIALREMALRQTAHRVDAQMTDYRREHAIERTWPAAERLLVCVGPSPMSARLIRATRRMAAGLRAPWIALHVETPLSARMEAAQRDLVARNLYLAEQLGGEIVVLSGYDLAQEVISYARSRNVTKIIIGKPAQSRWIDLIRGAYVYELTRRSGDIDVFVISGDAESPASAAAAPRRQEADFKQYVWAVLIVLLATAVGGVMDHFFAPTNTVMVYLLGIVAVSARFGRGPSILAAVAGVAAFDFFFIPPKWTFAVEDTEYLFTFAVMLLTATVISTLTARLKFQVESARGRARRAATLYEMSRELGALKERAELVEMAQRHIANVVDARVEIHLREADGNLTGQATGSHGVSSSPRDEGVVQWVGRHGEMAGLGTNTLPGADALYLPMSASRGVLGVLGVRPAAAQQVFDPDQIHLLRTLAGLTAMAIERADLGRQAEQQRIQVEAERLRNSLLSAVSHDLRTPLAAIAGASSTLLETDAHLHTETRRELATSIFEETARLNRLVANLLDMTRLEGGGLSVKKEWQPVEEIIGVVLRRLAGLLGTHTVRTHLPQNLPLVPFDDTLVQQVLVNLLENAVKYAAPGTAIDITAAAAAGEVCIEVADRGPGLKPGEEERVFDKFYRANGSQRSGVGLGLAICKGIVELHGGRIWVQNRSDGGAVFRFTLPIVGEPPQLPPEDIHSDDAPALDVLAMDLPAKSLASQPHLDSI